VDQMHVTAKKGMGEREAHEISLGSHGAMRTSSCTICMWHTRALRCARAWQRSALTTELRSAALLTPVVCEAYGICAAQTAVAAAAYVMHAPNAHASLGSHSVRGVLQYRLYW
jgi:hypothetical protein